MQIWNILNRFNLGDQLFNMYFFSQISEFIIDQNIFINYACKEEYFGQISEFIQPQYRDRIHFVSWKPHQDHVYKDYFLLWIGNREFQNCAYTCNKGFNLFLTDFFNEFLEKLQRGGNLTKGMNIPGNKIIIKELMYREIPIRSDLDIRYENLPDYMKDLDILFINSHPLSGQFKYNMEQWNRYIDNASKRGFKVATTLKVYDHIPCTLDFMMTLKTIAAISTHAKYIIAINTGPMAACMTEKTFANVRMIYIFDDNNTFDHIKIKKMTSIDDIIL